VRSRETFQQILVTVAPRNIQTLENQAQVASALAVTYPENEGVFRAIESDALQQIFRIVVREPLTGEMGIASGSGGGRPASVPSSIVYEEERGFRR